VIALAQKPTNATSDSELGSGTVGTALTATASRIQKASAVEALSTTLSKAGPLKLRMPNAMGSPFSGTTPVAVALPTSALKSIVRVRSRNYRFLRAKVRLGSVAGKNQRKIRVGIAATAKRRPNSVDCYGERCAFKVHTVKVQKVSAIKPGVNTHTSSAAKPMRLPCFIALLLLVSFSTEDFTMTRASSIFLFTDLEIN